MYIITYLNYTLVNLVFKKSLGGGRATNCHCPSLLSPEHSVPTTAVNIVFCMRESM